MTNDLYSTQAVAVSNGQVPADGKVYSLTLALVLNTPVAFDLKTLVNNHRIGDVQGVFVDNSLGTAAFSLKTSAGQNLIIPGGYQGVAPVYLSADKVIIFGGAGTVPVVLLNFPTPANVWPASTQTLPIVGGLLQVQDPALEATIANGGINANQILLGNADTAQHARAGTFFAGTLSAAATTTIITGAPSCFVSAIDVQISGDATLAAAGNLVVTGKFSTGGTLFLRTVQLATTAVGGNGLSVFHMEQMNLCGTLAGDNFQLQLSAALTAGSVQYTIIGGTTAVL